MNRDLWRVEGKGNTEIEWVRNELSETNGRG